MLLSEESLQARDKQEEGDSQLSEKLAQWEKAHSCRGVADEGPDGHPGLARHRDRGSLVCPARRHPAVLRVLEASGGDRGATYRFMLHPTPLLDGVAPIAVAQTPTGQQAVVGLLARVEHWNSAANS
jgi:hypothetical protein